MARISDIEDSFIGGRAVHGFVCNGGGLRGLKNSRDEACFLSVHDILGYSSMIWVVPFLRKGLVRVYSAECAGSPR